MFMYTDYNQHLLDNVKDPLHRLRRQRHVSAHPDPCRKGYEISGSDVLDGSIIRYEREMGVKGQPGSQRR